MKNLQAYIDRMNLWSSIFNTAEIQFPLSQTQVNDIANNLDSDLSPENLHCDGEISVAEANRKYRFYERVARELDRYCAKNGKVMPVIFEL